MRGSGFRTAFYVDTICIDSGWFLDIGSNIARLDVHNKGYVLPNSRLFECPAYTSHRGAKVKRFEYEKFSKYAATFSLCLFELTLGRLPSEPNEHIQPFRVLATSGESDLRLYFHCFVYPYRLARDQEGRSKD